MYFPPKEYTENAALSRGTAKKPESFGNSAEYGEF